MRGRAHHAVPENLSSSLIMCGFGTVQPGAEHADSKQFFILIGSLPRLKGVSVGGRLSGLRS